MKKTIEIKEAQWLLFYCKHFKTWQQLQCSPNFCYKREVKQQFIVVILHTALLL